MTGHYISISVSDGRRRELARAEAGYISKAVFSPDSRFVAYEVMPPSDESKSGTCRVFVVAAAGGEPHFVYESKPWDDYGRIINSLKDWTSDGRYLAIKDTEFGKPALYLLPMKNGAPAGGAEMVRYGDSVDAYTTASGALVYKEPSTKTTEKDAFIASLSSEGQVENWRRLDLRGGRSPNVDPFPSLSPSGTAVAYLASDQDVGKTDIILRELSTGQERVIYRSAAGRFYCHYASSLPKIFCTSSKKDKTTDLISVAVESGAVERLSSFDGPRFIHQLSPDDAIVYFTSDNFPTLGSILQWNMAAQKEVTLSTQLDKLETYAPSPDGNWLVRTSHSNMSVRPMTGGDWKDLVSGAHGLWWQTVVSPDSKWVFYHTIDQAGKHSLFRMSIAGGEPERMGDFPCESFSGLLNMNSEGRQILATCNGGSEGNAGYDLWVLENFEPPVKK